MASEDYLQVTTVLLRLRQLNPVVAAWNFIEIITEVIDAVSTAPPGKPATIRTLAGAYRTASLAIDPLATDLLAIGGTQLPDVWQSAAGASAGQVVTATAHLMSGARTTLLTMAQNLEVYAGALDGYQKRWHRMWQDLHDAWHDATHVGVFGVEITVPDVTAISRLLTTLTRLIGEAMSIYGGAASAGETLMLRLADARGKARAQAEMKAGFSDAEAVVYSDLGGDVDAAVLTAGQATRALALRAGLPPAERARLDAALAAAGSPEERAYLLKALAAGHSVAEIEEFAGTIRGKKPEWLKAHLRLLDPTQTGYVYINGKVVKQFDETTCGSTSILMTRALNDPLYALNLIGTDGDGEAFADRLAAEEQRIHDSTNTVWPQAIGTSPWGVAGALPGYDWHLVDDTDPGSIDPALDAATAAADRGESVPVLIGDGYPHHYVLLIGHEGDQLIFYNPSGDITKVSESDFRNGNLGALGYHHVQGVILPTGR